MLISSAQKLKYLNRRLDEIIELRSFASEKNFLCIKMIAHKLKGNGKTFGYPLITNYGQLLEEAASNEDVEKVSQLIFDLSDTVSFNLNELN